jgi:hypothetical protein
MSNLLAETATVLRDVYGLRTDTDHGTGGGCTAMLVHDSEGGADGFHVLIGDGNLGTDTDATGEIVGVVYTHSTDEGTLFLNCSTADTLAEPHGLAAAIAREI